MFPLVPNARERHSLLEPPSAEYSARTVQRAFLVWTRLGQRNGFTQVCGYFHRLEALEDTLPTEQRTCSRNLEYSLLRSAPPTSSYLQGHYPDLYPDLTPLIQDDDTGRVNELKVMLAATMTRKENTFGHQHQVTNRHAVNHGMNGMQNRWNLERGLGRNGSTKQELRGPVGLAFVNQETSQKVGFNVQRKKDQGLTTQNDTKEDVAATSNMIRSYCTTHQMTVNQFLAEFREYATKHSVNPTVSNVAFYIKHRTVLEERELDAIRARKLFTPSLVDGIKGKATDEVNLQSQRTKKTEVNSTDIFKRIFRDGSVSNRFAKSQKSQLELENDFDEILGQISQIRSLFNDEVNGKKSDSERRFNITETRDDIRDSEGVMEKLQIGVQQSNLLLNAISMSKEPKDSEMAMTVAKTQNETVTILGTAEIVNNGKQSAVTASQSKKRSVFGLKVVNLRGKSRKSGELESPKKHSSKDKKIKIKSVSMSIESFADLSKSCNPTDFEASFESRSNYSEDFDKMPINRCSTSSESYL